MVNYGNRRRFSYFLASLMCLAVSAGVYSAAVLNYPPPWNNPKPEGSLTSRSSALRVLVNQPQAQVQMGLKFNMFKADAMTAFTEVTFFNIPDPEKFRWALIGTGAMRFRAKMIPVPDGNPQATYDKLEAFTDAYVDTAPASWTPADVSSCPSEADLDKKINRPPLGAVSAVAGGLSWSTLVDSDGWSPIVANNLTVQLIFPEVVPETTLTSSTWTTGRIGDEAVDFSQGGLHFYRPECVAMYGFELKSPEKRVNLSATFYDTTGSKELANADPPSNSNVHGEWSRDEPFIIVARFEDSKWKSIRDAMIFFAGVIGGLFASMLVGGIQARDQT
ncbi:hypothetical protein AB0M22_17545 [Nocardia sp. NPDC051756]|uniref:hypothetical protein n=1 Tax=Nocardia sp. NPDC051756 TaxID=3154751 RepID=UPI00344A5B73